MVSAVRQTFELEMAECLHFGRRIEIKKNRLRQRARPGVIDGVGA